MRYWIVSAAIASAIVATFIAAPHEAKAQRFHDSQGNYVGQTWRDSRGNYRCRRANGTIGIIVPMVAKPETIIPTETAGERRADPATSGTVSSESPRHRPPGRCR